MQDLNDKITGGSVSAPEWNEIPSEIQNVIEALGMVLSSGDLSQLGKGIAGYVANGDFYTDSGAADAYVLTTIGGKQAPPAYTDGMRIRFTPDNVNAGASTVNVAALGVANLKDTDGVALTGGELTGVVKAAYDAGAAEFRLAGAQDYAPTVAGYVSGTRGYLHADSVDPTLLQIDAVLASATWESIGPMGSGADNIWTALNTRPAGAVGVRIKILAALSTGAAVGLNTSTVYARVTGSATAISNATAVSSARYQNTSGGAEYAHALAEVTIPIDSAGRFDMYFVETGTLVSTLVQLALVEWVVG